MANAAAAVRRPDATLLLRQAGWQRRAQPDWISPAQVRALLIVIGSDLHQALHDDALHAAFADLIRMTSRCAVTGDLSMACWATLSLELDTVVQHLAVATPSPDADLTRFAFVRHCVSSLARTCRYGWARIAARDLTAIFARQIARQATDNPAMFDSVTYRVAVDIGTPLPIVRVGAELNRQILHRINDEGNLVLTSQGSAGGRIGLGGRRIGAQGSGSLAYGTFHYCRTAKDHATRHFAQLVAEHRDLPCLAPYLSRAGSAGRPSTGQEEIANFVALQRGFQLHQDRYAQQFSLLLSAATQDNARQLAVLRAQPALRTPVQFCERADKYVRIMEGNVCTTSKRAKAELNVAVLRAGGSAESLCKTTRVHRTRTLCEFLKDDYAGPKDKQNLRVRLARASAPAKRAVAAFWGIDLRNDSALTMMRQLERMQRDWQHYTWLHAQQSGPGTATDAARNGLHAAYGARGQNDFLRRVAQLTADLYGRAQQLPGAPLAAISDFEQMLHVTAIPGARDFLAHHAQTSQQARYTSEQVTIELGGGIGVAEAGGSVATRGARITTWSVNHYTPWLHGENIKVEFVLGASQAANQQVLQSIADHFQVVIPELAPLFGTGSYAEEGSYVIKFSRCGLLAGQPFRKMFVRHVLQTSSVVGVEVPVSLAALTGGAVPVHVDVTVDHAEVSNRMLRETLATDSLLYFITHFTHARWTDKIGDDGRARQYCYWSRIEQRHQAELAQLFLRYAQDARRQGDLIRELAAIEQVFVIDAAGREAWARRRAAFLTAAAQFAAHRTPHNYHACLTEFRALMNACFPGWKAVRERAPNWQKWKTGMA